jgi:hypothetical protein
MRLLKYINELWMKNTYSNERFEVLENPSQKEIKEILRWEKYKSIRFISDNRSKKIWIWYEGNDVHSKIYQKVYGGSIDYKDVIDASVIIFGIAELKGGKYVMVESDIIEYYHIEKEGQVIDMDKLYKDSQWINSYVKVDKFLKKYKIKAGK